MTLQELDQFKAATQAVLRECLEARRKYPKFNSVHEGYAVLHEEVDELWEEVRKKERTKAAIRLEAIQTAAMAVRIAVECGE